MVRLGEKGAISIGDEDSKLRRGQGGEGGEDEGGWQPKRGRAWQRKAASAKAGMNTFSRRASLKGTGQESVCADGTSTAPDSRVPQILRYQQIVKRIGKAPCPPSAPYSESNLSSSTQTSGRMLWGAVRSIPTHFQCACCRGRTWENPGCLFN